MIYWAMNRVSKTAEDDMRMAVVFYCPDVAGNQSDGARRETIFNDFALAACPARIHARMNSFQDFSPRWPLSRL